MSNSLKLKTEIVSMILEILKGNLSPQKQERYTEFVLHELEARFNLEQLAARHLHNTHPPQPLHAESFMFNEDDFVLHVATGGVYQILSTPIDTFMEVGMVPSYQYRDQYGQKIIRAKTLMEDGRFVKITGL